MKIILSKGYRTQVDFRDGDLKQFNWHYHKGYAARKEKGKTVYMHRQITCAEKGQIVDHINGDTLDNRRKNLRLVTARQNQWNRKKNKNNSSGFPGVSFCQRENKWFSKISINYKRKHLGYFNNPKDAYRAYLKACAVRVLEKIS